MSATLKLTHKAIGVEVRRGTYDAVVDGERVGSVEMNDTTEIPIEAGHHSLQVRNGRNLSRILSFDAAEGQVVAFRCTGKRFLPIFLVSFVVPRLALSLRPRLAGALGVERFLSRSSRRAPVQTDAACASPPIAHAADEPMPDWVAPPEPGR